MSTLTGGIYALQREVLDAILSGGAIRAVVREDRPGIRAPSGVAVVPITGAISPRSSTTRERIACYSWSTRPAAT